MDYHRVTKIKPKEVPEGATWEFITWDYTEHLIIDRETETLEHIQNIGSGCKVYHKYEIVGGIESLLDDFDAEDLFGRGAKWSLRIRGRRLMPWELLFSWEETCKVDY